MRARSLALAACLALSAGLLWANAAYTRTPARAARNLILISLDTLRADHLGLYGHALDTSPELDRFAQSSFVFDWALASSPNTPPSHASIMTSLYPGRHGFTGAGDRLSAKFPTLAVQLQRAGFRTGAFTGGGFLTAHFGFERGFEFFNAGAGGLANIWRRAKHWLEAVDEHPFFLFLHCYDIHSPYLPPPPFRDMFHTEPYQGNFVATSDNMEAVFLKKQQIDAADMDHIRTSYDEGIRAADHQLGKVLRYLAITGLLEETLVVITSDHGEAFGEHGDVLHWQLYNEPNLRVPLVIHLPGNERRNVRIGERVQLIDLTPTLLDLLGVAPLAGAQGRSLAGALRHGASAWQHAIHSAWSRWSGPAPAYAWWAEPRSVPLRSAVLGRYQLIFSEWKAGGEQLFDVVADPMAQSDIAGQHPALVTQMRESAMQVMRANQSDPPVPAGELNQKTRDSLRALGYGID